MKEPEEHFDLSPHTRYYEEKFNRRRVRGRINYLFMFFGLSVSALTILVVIMLVKVTASFTG